MLTYLLRMSVLLGLFLAAVNLSLSLTEQEATAQSSCSVNWATNPSAKCAFYTTCKTNGVCYAVGGGIWAKCVGVTAIGTCGPPSGTSSCDFCPGQLVCAWSEEYSAAGCPAGSEIFTPQGVIQSGTWTNGPNLCN